jgi:hypothetical protein
MSVELAARAPGVHFMLAHAPQSELFRYRFAHGCTA